MHRYAALLTGVTTLCFVLTTGACLSWPEPPQPFAIAWSYDTSGYLETCGCSTHQLGGLARRATLLAQLRAKQPVLAIEGAHIIGDAGDFQLFKGVTIVQALNLMGYSAMQLGIREAQHGAAGLSELATTAKFPCFSANLVVDGQPWDTPYAVVTIAGARVGITGVSQPEAVSFELPADVSFSNPTPALDGILPKLRPKCDMIVVCLEGEHTWITGMAQAYATQAGLFLSGERGQPEAPLDFEATPPLLNTWDEGRFLGLVTVDPTAGGFSVAGTNLPVDDKLADLPEIKDLLDNTYRPQLKQRFFAQLKVDLRQLYLPPEYCADCHKEQVEKYAASGHARSLDTLVSGGQEYNPDCMSCHVVYDPDTDELKPMNCIVCHSNITDQHVWDAMNDKVKPPAKPVAQYTLQWCQQCHDPANSTNFAANWPQYVHRIYHGGNDKAARAAAKQLGLVYSAPPPGHEQQGSTP